MDQLYFQSIADSLKLVERPGHYVSGGTFMAPPPSLSIHDLPDAILGLPICESQVKDFIALASRAPFGKGEQTIIDTSVRCTWQLDPTQFSIKNSQWKENLKDLVDRVKNKLGCDDNMVVTCELYKLLLYEPGGFFKVH